MTEDGGVWLTETVQLGRHRDRRVLLGTTRRPEDAPAPDEFGVDCFVPTVHGQNVDVVGVDTAHAGCHVDRLYPPVDHPERRDYGLTFHSPEAVSEWLTTAERWREFIDRFDRNHGLPPTATDRLEKS